MTKRLHEPLSTVTVTELDGFDAFVASSGRRLRQALVVRYGPALGPDATAAALAWAWEHWNEVSQMANPMGYLFRVGQSSTRTQRRWVRRTSVAFPPERWARDLTEAIDLGAVMARLPYRQRVSVLLVHGHGWSYQEVATLLDVSVAAVTNHVHRGLVRLRRMLGEE